VLRLDGYFDIKYDETRFNGYFEEIKEIAKLPIKSILDIGVGSGFMRSYLNLYEYLVFSIDIRKDLKADLVCSVDKLPFSAKSFDLCLCCEVLEHLPYEKFEKSLTEIKSVISSHLILSLPDSSYYLGITLRHTPNNQYNHLFSFPILLHKKHVFDGAHYWEIGKEGYPLSRILADIKQAGFLVEKTYRSFSNPYCRMFLLKKVI
jgi:2-polyprenyl-3-methyl-5-hydroxy-6-metoxy-1,4-benzoquinol methylase